MNINDINMANLPDTVMMEVFVQIPPYGGQVSASSADMSQYGHIPLGKVTVEVPVPKDSNPVELMLEALDAKETRLRNELNVELNQIAEQKAQILALPWKSAEKKESVE
jgi:hypothetical protein